NATVARPTAADPDHVTFAVPVDLKSLPRDGMVVGDVAVTDPFGRAIHTSLTEFTGDSQLDNLLSLTLDPKRVLLAAGYGQRLPLKTTARFALAGDVDLSGLGKNVAYTS